MLPPIIYDETVTVVTTDAQSNPEAALSGWQLQKVKVQINRPTAVTGGLYSSPSYRAFGEHG